MAKKKDAGNYLELIPVRNPAFPTPSQTTAS